MMVLEWCGREQASFCQAGPGRLAVLVQAVQQDEVVLCRTRIGHTHLTHSYILRKDSPPQCEHCQFATFWWSAIVAEKRNDIFGRRNVVESFRFHPILILFYLKECHFYHTF